MNIEVQSAVDTHSDGTAAAARAAKLPSPPVFILKVSQPNAVPKQ